MGPCFPVHLPEKKNGQKENFKTGGKQNRPRF